MSTGKMLSHRKTKIKSETKPPSLVITEDGHIDWPAAVSLVKTSLGFIEDKDAAHYLEVPVSTFSEFRNATGNLPWMAKLRVLHLLGCESLSDAIDLLAREELAEKARRKEQRQARKSELKAP